MIPQRLYERGYVLIQSRVDALIVLFTNMKYVAACCLYGQRNQKFYVILNIRCHVFCLESVKQTITLNMFRWTKVIRVHVIDCLCFIQSVTFMIFMTNCHLEVPQTSKIFLLLWQLSHIKENQFKQKFHTCIVTCRID